MSCTESERGERKKDKKAAVEVETISREVTRWKRGKKGRGGGRERGKRRRGDSNQQVERQKEKKNKNKECKETTNKF